jgi:hypothetical protein
MPKLHKLLRVEPEGISMSSDPCQANLRPKKMEVPLSDLLKNSTLSNSVVLFLAQDMKKQPWAFIADDGDWYIAYISRGLFFHILKFYRLHLRQAKCEIRLALELHEQPLALGDWFRGHYLWLYKVKPETVETGEHWALSLSRGRYLQVINAYDAENDLPYSHNLLVYEENYPRAYLSTKLPTLERHGPVPRERRDEVLFKLYDHICSQWQHQTDVRFTLLGLVPTISLLAWSGLLKEEVFHESPAIGLIVSVLALLFLLGIRIYDVRNDALYNDLISRGRKIEEELGIHTGLFRGRRGTRSWLVSHGRATGIIYYTAFVGWILVMIWFLYPLWTDVPLTSVPSTPTPGPIP